MLTKEAGEIDWKLPAMEIWRRVRAYQPWPGSYTQWRGKQLKIIEAVPLADKGIDKPGSVVAIEESAAVFGVVSGDGVLGIIKVQLEGKKVAAAGEFLRGQREFLGTVLGSPSP
jgi:methionyl-tRNA formyltransferase